MKGNDWIVAKKSSIEGFGVFARKDIPQGTKIIEYTGRRITKKQADNLKDARYVFELNKRYDLDGNVFSNTAGLINHSCDPNCETENIHGHIWIISLHDIKKGEEVSYNYGYNLADYKDWPCKCGSQKCVGYIVAEEQWLKLKNKLENKKGCCEMKG